jgi:hypothetical protein
VKFLTFSLLGTYTPLPLSCYTTLYSYLFLFLLLLFPILCSCSLFSKGLFCICVESRNLTCSLFSCSLRSSLHTPSAVLRILLCPLLYFVLLLWSLRLRRSALLVLFGGCEGRPSCLSPRTSCLGIPSAPLRQGVRRGSRVIPSRDTVSLTTLRRHSRIPSATCSSS